jgi:hypothetical protein
MLKEWEIVDWNYNGQVPVTTVGPVCCTCKKSNFDGNGIQSGGHVRRKCCYYYCWY